MKTAIVTGGSSGIGLSCCRKFLENGYRVYELSRREPKIQTVGVKHISCDVTDEHSVSEAFKKIYNDSGSIDILVNNAGFGISGAVEFTELAEAKKHSNALNYGAFRSVVLTNRQCIFERKSEHERIYVAINADENSFHADFDAGCGTAQELITDTPHDFGGGTDLPGYSVAIWKMEH